MQTLTFCPAPDLVRLNVTAEREGKLRMLLITHRPAAPCPRCGQESTQVHSRYSRTAALRPWSGLPCYGEVETRKWFCRNRECPQQIFTERLPGFLAPYARRATDVVAWLRFVGYRLGGEEGSRVTFALGFGVSPDTMLRELQRAPKTAAQVVHLGVDDFALRKGQRYATLLIDLDTHQPIDLLADRDVETLAAWLREHPEIEYVSRDGSKLYAAAIRKGAPQAEQGSDPFHLAQGLTQALLEYFRHTEAQLTAAVEAGAQAAAAVRAEAATAAPTIPEALPVPPEGTPPERSPSRAEPDRRGAPGGEGPPLPRYGSSAREREESRASRHRRLEQYQAVKRLQGEGWEAARIAAELGLALPTAQRLMASTAFPERKKYVRRETCLTPYLGYLERRWAEGGRDAEVLWRELRDQGFPGGPSAVGKWVGGQWQAHVAAGGVRPPRHPPEPARVPLPSLRTAMWNLIHATRTAGSGLPDQDAATAPKSAFAAAFFRGAPETRLAVSLAGEFLHLLTTQRRGAPDEKRDRADLARQIEAWIARVDGSGIRPLRSFCTGLRQDWAAVLAALTNPWSNGVVEGHVNRVKAIKRQMYGRGNRSTLRNRVVPLCG